MIAKTFVSIVAATITPAFVEQFYDGAIDGWYDEGPIDWEEALRRFEDGTDWDFGDQMDSAAIKKLQRLVRAYRAENGIF